MSDIPTSAGRMYRTLSGYSLADAEAMLPGARRGSEQVGNIGGKRSFRSKRFSRNLDREPSLKRAQSFHMDQREDGDLWLDSQRRTFQRATSKNSINSEHFGVRSDSSDNEEPVHFTSTVTSTTRGPGGVGSYLARYRSYFMRMKNSKILGKSLAVLRCSLDLTVDMLVTVVVEDIQSFLFNR